MTILIALMKLLTIWFAFNIAVAATLWYAVSTIKPLFPKWWQKTVCDTTPRPSK